jgi:hypothetical protein
VACISPDATSSGPAPPWPAQTGDNTDNAQPNETRWSIDLLDGATVSPDSGDLTRFEGVADSDPLWYDAHYWHPEGTPPGAADDFPRSRYGFPVVPGLLDAARRPFDATGLAMPWYTAFGNHDTLVQGNLPATPQLTQVAEGGLKLISPPPSAYPSATASRSRTAPTGRRTTPSTAARSDSSCSTR